MEDQDPQGVALDQDPQFAAVAQYIKDFSVESPSAPMVFSWASQPQLDVQFNIGVNQVADGAHEVTLRIEIKAASDQGTHFLVDLSYGGVFAMTNIPEDARPPYLLIEPGRPADVPARGVTVTSWQRAMICKRWNGRTMAAIRVYRDVYRGTGPEQIPSLNSGGSAPDLPTPVLPDPTG